MTPPRPVDPRTRQPLLVWGGLVAAAVAAIAFLYSRSESDSQPDQDAGGPSSSGPPAESTAREDDTPPKGRPASTSPPPIPDDDVLRTVANDTDPTFEKLRMLAKKNPAEARRLLDAKLVKNPKDRRALAERTVLHLEAEEYSAARKAAVRCLQIDPSDEMCRRARAFSYSREGEMENRLPVMKACLSASRSEPACLDSYVVAHIKRGELDEARAIQKELGALDAPGGYDDLAAGRIAESEEKRDVALKHYESACDYGIEDACDRADELEDDDPSGNE